MPRIYRFERNTFADLSTIPWGWQSRVYINRHTRRVCVITRPEDELVATTLTKRGYETILIIAPTLLSTGNVPTRQITRQRMRDWLSQAEDAWDREAWDDRHNTACPTPHLPRFIATWGDGSTLDILD